MVLPVDFACNHSYFNYRWVFKDKWINGLIFPLQDLKQKQKNKKKYKKGKKEKKEFLEELPISIS